jgi:5-methylcytosine-specific restriction endonuclease McrA
MQCALCLSKKEKTSELVCHHIVGIKKNGSNIEMLCDKDNIMVLCHDCHDLVHRTRRKYKNFGNQMLGGAGSVCIKIDRTINSCKTKP